MKKIVARFALVYFLISALSVFTSGCQTVQNVWDSTKEIVGIQKRDMMISEIKDARQSLEDVKVQFQSAMDKFNTVLFSKEGKLEEKYKTLKAENEKTGKKAGDIQKSIDSVIRVSEAVFAEWEAELGQYYSENLRSGSEKRLQEAKSQNNRFINAMTQANEKAGPVMAAFNDLVLYSRHNLNSEAGDSLTIELESVKGKIEAFFQEVDTAKAEADSLLSMMAGSEAAVKSEKTD
ncbi:MAG: DUF2959 family protein [Nitrospirota bacterium]